jgi:hypothetical protein
LRRRQVGLADHAAADDSDADFSHSYFSVTFRCLSDAAAIP